MMLAVLACKIVQKINKKSKKTIRMDDSFIVLTSSPSTAQASCQATLSSAPSFAAALQRGREP
jgi:hypothetical protein